MINQMFPIISWTWTVIIIKLLLLYKEIIHVFKNEDDKMIVHSFLYTNPIFEAEAEICWVTRSETV